MSHIPEPELLATQEAIPSKVVLIILKYLVIINWARHQLL